MTGTTGINSIMRFVTIVGVTRKCVHPKMFGVQDLRFRCKVSSLGLRFRV